MVECGSGQVCIYPQTNYGGVPYVRRASDDSTSLANTVINDHTFSVINNGTGDRTARIYRASNYTGSHTCIQPGGRIGDLEGYPVGRWGSSLRLNNDRCG
ncbi:Peptidase inhibitor family I36 [Nonomuraea solani]|uniref:Peptidase inhibitor family I36 n=1 Tax=Nonomuraea solani TaxID=1144553 RepID=A0A1H6EUK7_9ACTN|nr:Peptidase inhibitor family I36 [Nonomuraea solani]